MFLEKVDPIRNRINQIFLAVDSFLFFFFKSVIYSEWLTTKYFLLLTFFFLNGDSVRDFIDRICITVDCFFKKVTEKPLGRLIASHIPDHLVMSEHIYKLLLAKFHGSWMSEDASKRPNNDGVDKRGTDLVKDSGQTSTVFVFIILKIKVTGKNRLWLDFMTLSLKMTGNKKV